MAVELAQQIFDEARQSLLRRFGATTGDLEELRQQMTQYRGVDMVKFEQTAGRLARLTAFQDMVMNTTNPFDAALQAFFPDNQIDQPTQGQEYSKPEMQAERKSRSRKPEKYIDGAAPTVAMALIEKDDSGKLKFKSLDQIGKLALQNKLRGDKKAVGDARLYAYQTAVDVAEGIVAENAKNRSRTMAALLKHALPKDIPNQMWQEFYENVATEFGQMSPGDFVKKVLLRFHQDDVVSKLIKTMPKKEKKKATSKVEKTKIPGTIKPGTISPLNELTLANQLVRESVQSKLMEIFGGHNILSIAKSHGFVCRYEDLGECLQASRESMADRRQGKIPEDKEGFESMRVVAKAIRLMSQNRQGWNKIDPDYQAFRLIFSLLAEVKNEPGKVEKIIDTIFPRQIYQADAGDGFRLMGLKDES